MTNETTAVDHRFHIHVESFQLHLVHLEGFMSAADHGISRKQISRIAKYPELWYPSAHRRTYGALLAAIQLGYKRRREMTGVDLPAPGSLGPYGYQTLSLTVESDLSDAESRRKAIAKVESLFRCEGVNEIRITLIGRRTLQQADGGLLALSG